MPNANPFSLCLAWPWALEDRCCFILLQVVLPKEATTVEQCYVELAKQVRDKLASLDPYFVKLADAMVTWIDCWQEHSKSSALANGPSKPGKAK